MKHRILISVCLLSVACGELNERKIVKEPILIACGDVNEVEMVKEPILKEETEPVAKNDWKDSLIKQYLKNPKNELIKGLVNSDDSLQVVWGTENQERDGKIYTAVQIGKNFEHRFATSGWIYLDSTNRTIFEYDVANDSLIPWKNK